MECSSPTVTTEQGMKAYTIVSNVFHSQTESNSKISSVRMKPSAAILKDRLHGARTCYKRQLHLIALADLKGDASLAPPGGSIISISCSFWENLAKL